MAVRSDALGREAVRRAVALLDSNPVEPFDWKPGTVAAMPRATTVNNRLRRDRVAILGNSVVPDAVRLAFDLLVRSVATAPERMQNAPIRPGTRKLRGWPSAGCWTAAAEAVYRTMANDTETRRMPVPLPELNRSAVCARQGVTKRPRQPDWQEGRLVGAPLLFDPAAYPRPDGYRPSPLLRPELHLASPVRATRWATPRHGCISASVVLTRRTIRDLPTQVRFEAETPDGLRGGQMEAGFVELLMGYPPALRLMHSVVFRYIVTETQCALHQDGPSHSRKATDPVKVCLCPDTFDTPLFHVRPHAIHVARPRTRTHLEERSFGHCPLCCQ